MNWLIPYLKDQLYGGQQHIDGRRNKIENMFATQPKIRGKSLQNHKRFDNFPQAREIKFEPKLRILVAYGGF